MEENKLTKQEKAWIDKLENIKKVNYIFMTISGIGFIGGFYLAWCVYSDSNFVEQVMSNQKIETLINSMFAFMAAFLLNAMNNYVKFNKLVREFQYILKKLS